MVRELLIVSLACSAVVAPALVESLLGTTCPAVAWLGLFAGLVALPRGEVRGGARDRSLALLVIAIAIVVGLDVADDRGAGVDVALAAAVCLAWWALANVSLDRFGWLRDVAWTLTVALPALAATTLAQAGLERRATSAAEALASLGPQWRRAAGDDVGPGAWVFALGVPLVVLALARSFERRSV